MRTAELHLVQQPPAVQALAATARRLWPDSPRNQREWVRAVMVVRRTREGWLLDSKVRAK